MLWTSYDLLYKFYTFYMAAVIGIASRCGLTIEAHHRNQLNKSKLSLYKLLHHFNSHLKQLYISDKTECLN